MQRLHFSSVCLAKRKPRKMNFVDLEQPSDSEYSEDELFIAMVQQVNAIQEDNDEWTETLIINNTEIKFQLDVMSKSTFETTNLDLAFSKSDAPLRSYFGHIIKTLSSIILPCTYRKKMYQIKFHVINRYNLLLVQNM